ncbi:serine/threonine-protein kinase [Nocardia aurantiaca]|uniref:serine/threonine-protein kinase n=1 Tax=Nocardia aurantiaca TaxID=2675850 RepID=UPI0018AB6EC1|nr:serine/threonine-protein kinase [Nocardia aurantiaca]
MGRTLAQGQIFAGYTVERLLGVGGMGEVYLARDRDLPRSVALKLLASGKADDPEVRARFLREADTAARLSHPNIVAVYARGDDDHRLWMAMQYIEGTDVSAVLREGPIRPDHAVRVIGETARALDHAHRAGVLHRDVKPANILLAWGPDQRVYLADFGIAKAVDQTSTLTRTGEMYASFQYAAPEQFELRGDTDHRADVYALGCTLFHMLTGQLPYPGETTAQLVAAHLGAEIPRPSLVHPAVPATFDVVIERALAKNRDQRFGSCGELAAAAQRALTATGSPGRWVRQDGPGLGSVNIPAPQSRMGFDPSKFTGATTEPSMPTVAQINVQPNAFTVAPPSYGGPAGSGSHPIDAAPPQLAAPNPAPAAPPRHRGRGWLIAGVAVAVVLAGGLGAGFGTGAFRSALSGGGHTTAQPPAAADSTAATQAACDYAKLVTTYEYGNGDNWQTEVIAGATGTWKSQAETLLPTIRILLESDSEHTRAADATCTVTSGGAGHYEFAVDVTQINSTKGAADTSNHSKITISMDYVDGKWLCGNLVSPLFPS